MGSKRQGSSHRPKLAGKEARQKDGQRRARSSSKPNAPSALRTDTLQGGATSAVAEVASQAEIVGDRFPVVGIGASAGGLEALQELFGNMPADTGMAFIVVTHQQPGHTSMLPTLLGKSTPMPVLEVYDGLPVEQNHVYVGAPGSLLTINDRTFRCVALDPHQPSYLPIDHFFRSLAADQREHAICIVLSGTGGDGTLGLRAIKAELGMAMVQEPPSAKYGGMPSSAVATGLADYILPAPAMPQQLIAYARGPYLLPRFSPVETGFPPEQLQRILTLLRARTGHDFASYKETTVRRRLERRMNIHQIKEPQTYLRYLQENPHEIDTLFNELLISVTNFFRDPQAFLALAERALPGLLETRTDASSFRVWVPGCATGEEAYSLAILFREYLQRVGRGCSVQVFGTDLDARAIDGARAGVYTPSIAADVSKERLERYFSSEHNTFRVRKEIREMLVFATHNVIKDPPFTKLDLIACRNLLIYLDSGAQRRLLPIFHYALRPGGLLFLGPSETIGGFADLFDTVDAKWKIYRRKEVLPSVQAVAELPWVQPALVTGEAELARVSPGAGPSHTTTVIERLLLTRFAPTTLVVNDRGEIIYIHGRTSTYLELSEGPPRNNLLEMARPGLAHPLTAALRQAVVEKQEAIRTNLRIKSDGDFIRVNLAVAPLGGPEAVRGLFVVTIVAVTATSPPIATKPSNLKKSPPGRAEELEQELRYVKESLQTTVEELQTSNEELKSTNEELQSTNEELQSANEELETSKEEMQSLNEELSTVNAELQAKVDDLSRATNDMQNLLNNTDVATIFLDEELRVKRYTEPAKRLVNFIPGDVGRPLGDLSSNMDYNDLIDDCRQVLQSLTRKEIEIRTRQGSWHLMRIIPYRTAENMIDGVAITFLDIDRPKREVEAVREFFQSIVQAVRDPLVVINCELRVEFANEAFCRRCGLSRTAVEKHPLFEVGQGQWNSPELRRRLTRIFRKNTSFHDLVLEVTFPGDSPQRFRLNARRLVRGPDQPAMVLVVMEELAGKDS